MAKEPTEFCCQICGRHLERQHWGITEDLKAYQDRLTCADPNCSYYKLVRCIHKRKEEEG